MKKIIEKITCDSCEKDISPRFSSYPSEYILKVESIDVARHSTDYGIFAVLCNPPIKNDLYFCGLECMKKFGDPL